MNIHYTPQEKVTGSTTRLSTIKTVALATIISATFASNSVSAATMVVNGDFEAVDHTLGIQNGGFLDELATSGPSWDVFGFIPGWTGSGAGIEIQTNRTLNTVDAHSGGHYVELDSHGTGSNSGMSQAITLNKGTYQLSFWYSPRENTAGTNTIDYSIGSLSGSVSGPGTGTAVGSWTSITDRKSVV